MDLDCSVGPLQAVSATGASISICLIAGLMQPMDRIVIISLTAADVLQW